MKKYIFIAACLCLSYSVTAQDRKQPQPGPAPTINIGKPETFTLKNGLKVMIVENHKLPRVSYNLTIDNTPYAEGDKKGVSDLLSEMLGNGTQKISKDAFTEEVDFLGASIGYSSQGAYGSGLSKYADRILELMADGALRPVLTQQELDDNRNRFIESLKSEEKNTSAIASRVQDVLTFGKNHPSGEYTTEETLKNVTLQDVKNNYNSYFVPSNAYLVVIGDVDAKKLKKKIEKEFGSWKKAVAPSVTITEPKNVQYSQINFIDVPNAVQSEIALINTYNLKMSDKDFFPTILANQILGGGGEGRLFLNLREKHGYTYGAYSSASASKYTTTFSATSSVRNAVTDSATVQFFHEINKIRKELVSTEDLKNAKAKYIGNFVMQIQKPATVARYALNTQTQNLPADFYENYIKNINAVTAADIQHVANKYFLADQMRVVIAGKASEVLPNLEKTAKQHNLPILFFDKFGNPTEKPLVNKPIPAGVTASTIITDYINAVGGEKKIKEIKTLKIVSSGTIQGQPIESIQRKTADGKESVEMKMMGQTVMKQVVGATSGYSEMQGQKQPMSADEFKEAKAEAAIFAELNFAKNNAAKITGIESINDKDAYAVLVGEKTYYYDVQSKLKVAVKEVVEAQGQKMDNITYYGNYKEVKGLKIPHEVDLNIGIPLKLMVTEVTTNSGVSDADFK